MKRLLSKCFSSWKTIIRDGNGIAGAVEQGCREPIKCRSSRMRKTTNIPQLFDDEYIMLFIYFPVLYEY